MTGGDAQSQVPSWSRDVRWIYFESDRSGQWRIWKVPPEGGSAVQVARNIGGAAFESVDGKCLYITSTGEIEGHLEIPAHRLTIGMAGRVRGDVLAAEAVAMGMVEGNVDAGRKFVMRASARMAGSIRTPSLTMEEGAFFKGRIETV